ncbi:MAG: PfkB family carbohydrate kinase [Thermomicrobium sp.]|nr:PfkB family carbohydrate kinase [Thermomicrobium sp.]
MTTSCQLLHLLDRIATKRFLVVGDLYLDRYVFGEPVRISREAPVLVLEEHRVEHRPGGGAAPGLALAALGARVHQLGVVGDDPEGALLRQLLAERNVETSGVLVDPTRPTTVKTRVVAVGPYNVLPQQLVRIDRQVRHPLAQPLQAQLADLIAQQAPQVDAILLSDYQSGVLTEQIIATALARAELTVVDSQGRLSAFRGATAIKCNRAEAERFLGRPLASATDRAVHLTALWRELACHLLVVTLGGEGAALVTGAGYVELPPPAVRAVFDVTGAGDTVLALLAAALASGADPVAALTLAQFAASIVIGKFGNAQASREELRAVLMSDAEDAP